MSPNITAFSVLIPFFDINSKHGDGVYKEIADFINQSMAEEAYRYIYL
ncbi:hypothetical protein [Aegicerativicinus sediminis]|nr:hypothetical protein [Aegicerativicinus sediminis]